MKAATSSSREGDRAPDAAGQQLSSTQRRLTVPGREDDGRAGSRRSRPASPSAACDGSAGCRSAHAQQPRHPARRTRARTAPSARRGPGGRAAAASREDHVERLATGGGQTRHSRCRPAAQAVPEPGRTAIRAAGGPRWTPPGRQRAIRRRRREPFGGRRAGASVGRARSGRRPGSAVSGSAGPVGGPIRRSSVASSSAGGRRSPGRPAAPAGERLPEHVPGLGRGVSMRTGGIDEEGATRHETVAVALPPLLEQLRRVFVLAVEQDLARGVEHDDGVRRRDNRVARNRSNASSEASGVGGRPRRRAGGGR